MTRRSPPLPVVAFLVSKTTPDHFQLKRTLLFCFFLLLFLSDHFPNLIIITIDTWLQRNTLIVTMSHGSHTHVGIFKFKGCGVIRSLQFPIMERVSVLALPNLYFRSSGRGGTFRIHTIRNVVARKCITIHLVCFNVTCSAPVGCLPTLCRPIMTNLATNQL